MRLLIVGLSALALSGAATLAAADTPSPAAAVTRVDPDTVKARAAEVFSQLQSEGYSGSVAITLNGREVFTGASGRAGKGRPYRTETVTDIASISKPVTAMALMQLVGAGKVSLDDPLSRWFPAAPADKARITIRQLLTHEAGLVDLPPSVKHDYDRVPAADMQRLTFAEPLEFAPGSKDAYCNSCYDLLGMIVEKASGRSLEDYLQARVFGPAGVRASHDPGRFEAGRIANGIDEETGASTDFPAEGLMARGPYWGLWGAGGIYMDVGDLARLMDAYMAGRIVPRPAMDLMLKPYEVSTRAGSHQGLGWVLQDTRRGSQAIWHNGGSVYGTSAVRHYPEAGLTIATTSVRTAKSDLAPTAHYAGSRLAQAIVGPDVDLVTTLPGDALAPTSTEARLYAAFVAAAYGSDADRAAFLKAHVTEAWRTAGADHDPASAALARMLRVFPKPPKVYAMAREPDGFAVLVHLVDHDWPMALKLVFTVKGDGNDARLDGARLKRP